MANLVQIAEELEFVPKEQLVTLAQDPNSRFPQYMVVSEIQRRTQMEKMYAAQKQRQQPDTTVTDELLSEFSQPRQGLEQVADMRGAANGMQQPMPQRTGFQTGGLTEADRSYLSVELGYPDWGTLQRRLTEEGKYQALVNQLETIERQPVSGEGILTQQQISEATRYISDPRGLSRGREWQIKAAKQAQIEARNAELLSAAQELGIGQVESFGEGFRTIEGGVGGEVFTVPTEEELRILDIRRTEDAERLERERAVDDPDALTVGPETEFDIQGAIDAAQVNIDTTLEPLEEAAKAVPQYQSIFTPEMQERFLAEPPEKWKPPEVDPSLYSATLPPVVYEAPTEQQRQDELNAYGLASLAKAFGSARHMGEAGTMIGESVLGIPAIKRAQRQEALAGQSLARQMASEDFNLKLQQETLKRTRSKEEYESEMAGIDREKKNIVDWVTVMQQDRANQFADMKSRFDMQYQISEASRGMEADAAKVAEMNARLGIMKQQVAAQQNASITSIANTLENNIRNTIDQIESVGSSEYLQRQLNDQNEMLMNIVIYITETGGVPSLPAGVQNLPQSLVTP